MIALLPYSPTIHTAMQGAFLAVLVIAIWAASKAFRVYPETVAAWGCGFIALLLWIVTNHPECGAVARGKILGIAGWFLAGCGAGLVVYSIRKLTHRLK